MLKIIQYILAIQALINIGKINIPVATNTFDKVINFINHIFSSLYIFIKVNNFLNLYENNIVKFLFIENSDYLLLKVLVTIVSNFREINKGDRGLITVMLNSALFIMHENKNIFFSLMFSNVVFSEIVLPWIKIAYNSIFLGKDLVFLKPQKDKLLNGIYYLTSMYFFVVVIMTRKYSVE